MAVFRAAAARLLPVVTATSSPCADVFDRRGGDGCDRGGDALVGLPFREAAGAADAAVFDVGVEHGFVAVSQLLGGVLLPLSCEAPHLAQLVVGYISAVG